MVNWPSCSDQIRTTTNLTVMILSSKEAKLLRDYLFKIDNASRTGAKKNYITNQVRNIRLILNRADRREQNTIFNEK